MNPATFYRIKVKGHLDPHWSAWFGDLSIQHTPEGETILSGPLADQSALLGLLLKFHNLNLTILSVSRNDPVAVETSKASYGFGKE